MQYRWKQKPVSSGRLERMMEGKRLRKSAVDRKIAGVCGGIGEYLNVDPTLIRLVWVILAFCGGCGLIAYIVASIIMPD